MHLPYLLTLLACFGGGDADPPSDEAPATDADEERPALEIGKPGPGQPAQPVPSPAAPPPKPDDLPDSPITEDMCEDLEDGGDVPGPDCITDTLSCGDEIIGHTLGGVQRYDTKFYEKHHCTPATSNHDGGDERVYLLAIPPGDTTATVTLHTPCADLDLAALRSPSADACPAPTTRIRQCEMWPKAGDKSEKVMLTSRDGANWFVVVEGKDDHEGAFALTVSCEDHL